MPARLIRLRGELQAQEFLLIEIATTIGRHNDNLISTTDRSVSRRHAEIRREVAGYVIYDMGSASGTLINQRPIQVHVLKSGDVIELGQIALRFEDSLAPTSHHLVGVHGSINGRRLQLTTAAISFGRNPSNNVVLSSGQVSRIHAELRYESEGYVLYDQQSANGTYVNQQRITRQVLQPGDVIQIGDETMRFEVMTPSEAAQADPPSITLPIPNAVPAAYGATPAAGTPISPVQPDPSKPTTEQPQIPHLGFKIRCPKCGRSFDPHVKYCTIDGTSLANGVTVFGT